MGTHSATYDHVMLVWFVWQIFIIPIQDCLKFTLSLNPCKFEKFPLFWGIFQFLKYYPKLKEFPQIWGNFVRQKHVFPNHFHFKCLACAWNYDKIFFSYWGMSMNYYSIFRTLLPSQKQEWKIAISPNLGEFPNFEICNFSKFGEIL